MRPTRPFRVSYMGAVDEAGDFRQEDQTLWASSAKYAARAALRQAPAWARAMDLSDDGPHGLLGTSFIEGQYLPVNMTRWTIDDDGMDEMEQRERDTRIAP